jgi:hypothetical protein
MFRIWKRVPSLQRRLLYLVCATTVVFFVYLVMTMSYNTPATKMDQSLLAGLKWSGRELHPTQQVLRTGALEAGLAVVVDSHVAHKPLSDSSSKRTSHILRMVTQQASHNAHQAEEEAREDNFKEPVLNSSRANADPYSGPQNERQAAVVDSFMHAWNAYKKYAWGHDELRPVTHGWQEWFGIGLTIIDSMDTMYIMGLKEEFKLSREWVAHNLTFARDSDAQLFEIVIRALGGLMSAYHLSHDRVFLHKALELGNRLYPCFSGPTKVPCNRVNLRTGRGSFIEISTAETGTIQLEFRDLARTVEDNKFEKAVEDISLHIHRLPKLDGLVPCFMNAQTGTFRMSSTVSVGASADSYYEYLLKQWLQTGRTKDWLRDDYTQAVEGIRRHLLKYTVPSKLAFVGALSSMHSKAFRPEMEHLACFLPGTLALGWMYGLGHADSESHLDLAKELVNTCYEMYRRMPTGLSPEVAGMNTHAGAKEDIYINFGTQHNLQRPETVESLFYMYRATKDKKYQEWGWEIYQSFEKYTKLAEGYASINSVRRPENPGYRDKMETFYLAETLKYLYLLFSDDPELMSLDKWVINTEAHPLPIYSS